MSRTFEGSNQAKGLFWYLDVKHRERSCGKKVRYSKYSAILAATALEEQTEGDFTVYECQYCKQWHVGHSLSSTRHGNNGPDVSA